MVTKRAIHGGMYTEEPRRMRDLLNDVIRVVEDAWADGSLQWSCADYSRVMDRIAPELFDVSPSDARLFEEAKDAVRQAHFDDLAGRGR